MWEMAGAIYGAKDVPYVHELLVNSTHGSPIGPLDSHGKPTGPATPYRYVDSTDAIGRCRFFLFPFPSAQML